MEFVDGCTSQPVSSQRAQSTEAPAAAHFQPVQAGLVESTDQPFDVDAAMADLLTEEEEAARHLITMDEEAVWHLFADDD